jgi:hypothetical protein
LHGERVTLSSTTGMASAAKDDLARATGRQTCGECVHVVAVVVVGLHAASFLPRAALFKRN